MKTLFFVALIFVSCFAKAQTFLIAGESMSPFCQVMAPLMVLLVLGGIGYVVVKAIKEKDKTA